jgi:mono/diheme cytochrome c family protein
MVLFLVAACDKPASRAAATATAPDPAVVARGAYLVNVVMSCAGCHTLMGPQGPDMSRAFAGGFEVKESFGTWRSLNITQDAKTGIGGWTDDEIIDAIREGKRPDGSQLSPIMPYPLFHVLSDDDAHAVVAYLRTIKPVDNAVARATDLKLPKPRLPSARGTRPPAPAPAARGQYLATVMACVQCHTPMDATGGPDLELAYAGGTKFDIPPPFGGGESVSANITPDARTGIGSWTDAEIANAIVKMVKRDGTPIRFPMAVHGAPWGGLAHDDVTDVVAFLRTLPAVDHDVTKLRAEAR